MDQSPNDELYQALREAIQRRVCSVCLDQTDDGTCGLRGRTCAIERHLPALAETIAGIHSNRMDEYVAAVEAHICGRCEAGDQGVCGPRDRGECALYMYLALVVDAIEEVKETRGQEVVKLNTIP